MLSSFASLANQSQVSRECDSARLESAVETVDMPKSADLACFDGTGIRAYAVSIRRQFRSRPLPKWAFQLASGQQLS
ncbi:unnamed protein product [Protopolystoma xenopodis]|uniref:Uncharacterized protein n=1 Tax=Protopolystoma xenopodis TaxID=117903 RepID=A0A3S5BRA3_9PLAT|nr:unnamed protein product [Protopolystoma xenopodis]